MLGLRSPKGLSGSARKWPGSSPTTVALAVSMGARADAIPLALLWQKPQGPTQVCLKPEALGSPRSPEVTRQVEGWGHRGEKGEDA